jgi:S1-C subfamily serine protease
MTTSDDASAPGARPVDGISRLRRIPSPYRQPAAWALAAAAVAGVAGTGCARYVPVDRGPQAYYQTAFPAYDVSRQLDQAFRAVKRIRVTGVYDHYRFAPETGLREGDFLGADVLARAVDTFTNSTSREASAVQVARANRRITLLTNQHAIHFPDTVVEYAGVAGRGRPVPPGPRRIESVSVKRDQYNLVMDRTGIQPFEVLARDVAADLALIGASYPADAEAEVLSILQVQVGDADRLSWGSFVYVLGHPGGYPIVTRGIVSDPRREATGSFLIDGLWNEGISGGPILAVRGQEGRLEWVGVARAAAGRIEHRLAPDPEAIQDLDQRLLYEGRIYLEEVRRILYGISLSVPMTTIREFINRNRADLRRRGWETPRL